MKRRVLFFIDITVKVEDTVGTGTGTVASAAKTPRTYLVETERDTARRNRAHLISGN